MSILYNESALSAKFPALLKISYLFVESRSLLWAELFCIPGPPSGVEDYMPFIPLSLLKGEKDYLFKVS